jgi:hypothetical protein
MLRSNHVKEGTESIKLTETQARHQDDYTNEDQSSRSRIAYKEEWEDKEKAEGSFAT